VRYGRGKVSNDWAAATGLKSSNIENIARSNSVTPIGQLNLPSGGPSSLLLSVLAKIEEKKLDAGCYAISMQLNRPPRTQRDWSTARIVGLLLLPTLVVAGATADRLGLSSFLSSPQAGCNIKGNISMRTGERIYHVPGGKFYDLTVINPAKGERWFCSEAEARAAGWRRSPR